MLKSLLFSSAGATLLAAGFAFHHGWLDCPLAAVCGDDSATALAPPVTAPAGRYVEARTANVFVGACHYQGEYAVRGREAVLAWRLDSGEFAGEPLAGLRVVAAVVGEGNLDEVGTRRRAVVYLPASASEASRTAALAWLKSEHAASLGEIVAVRTGDVRVDVEGDRFAVRAAAGDELGTTVGVTLVGAALPDRACCTMPFDVWYRPFASVEAPLVGLIESFKSTETALASRWSAEGDNGAFLGRFPAVQEL